MKKTSTAVLAIILICSLLCGCYQNSEKIFAGKRPIDYESTRWISKLGISFEVHDGEASGEMTLHNKTIPIQILFEFQGSGIDIYEADNMNWDDVICYGRCSFSTEMLVVKLSPSSPKPFGEDIDRIVFLREDIPLDKPVDTNHSP